MKIYSYCLSDFTDEDYNYWYALLHEGKRKRVDSYKHEDDKRRSVCAHMLALKAISEQTGLEVSKITIAETENGKPYCPDIDIFFSLSHAENKVVCAVSHKPIGIDIEKIRAVNLSTAKRICTQGELEYIFGHSPAPEEFVRYENGEILERFFEIWVKKEAFGKKEGSGVAYEMKKTDLRDMSCTHEDGYVIAVCE